MSVRSNSIVTPGSRGARSPILLPFLNAFAMLLLFGVFFKFFYNDVHGSLYVQLYCYKNSKFGRWLITLYRL